MSTTEQQTEVRAAVDTVNRRLVDAFRRRDAAGCASLWKREAGQWRIHRDIVNSSRPA
jgi:hypothetical protein